MVNPKKGYIVSCNNQIVPLTYKYLGGDSASITGRFHRANEIIRDTIKNKTKFDLQFMGKMQLDVYDSMAREILKLLIQLASKNITEFFNKNSSEFKIINHMLEIVKEWNYEAEAESKGALVYNEWTNEILNNLLQAQIYDNWIHKIISHSFTSLNYLGKVLKDWTNNVNVNSIYCQPRNHTGESISCIYVLINSLLTVHKNIIKNFGQNEKNWQWGNKNFIKFKCTYIIFTTSYCYYIWANNWNFQCILRKLR